MEIDATPINDVTKQNKQREQQQTTVTF